MTKYDFVLYSGQSEDFIERLRELGLVDITTTGWEAQEDDRQLVTDIEARLKAKDALELFRTSESFIESAGTTTDVFQKYTAASQKIAELRSDIGRMTKIASEWSAWGDFSVETVKNLLAQGVVLRFFTTQRSTFDAYAEAWNSQFNISIINEVAGIVYFVVVTDPDTDVVLDAMEAKLPQCDAGQAEAEVVALEAKIAEFDTLLSQCALSISELDAEIAALKERLQNVKIEESATREADGLLMVMEGWAEAETAEKVDSLLEQYPNVVYIKSEPTPEDDTPVKLKNNRFARLFEMIGGLYALPKYGTLDMTPFFAPFYMLFFAICLNDAGYGAIIFTLGLVLALKSKAMRTAGYLTMVCGGATTLFGLYTGSLFGMSIPALMGYPDMAECPIPFLDFQGKFFSWALALGVFQILFGMLLNIIFKARTFGITSTFALLGWFIILVSGCLAGGLQLLNPAWVIPWFTTSSIAFYVAMGVGFVLMLLLNDVHRNPVMNFASGLWDTYNNITGLLSDVLSYIRLFAIGLSGGVLAQVFNSLAMGLTGLDAGIGEFGVGTIFQILGATAILLVGHGINLFMSAISSFVHPMRLTFVEFYKNAGFEMTTRAFEPLKKEQ
ncbi:MAG: V-type ATP synthase subunit I [Alistipes sp.]|nr:V-type ATP synthase subunit I [Alistipes sp.]